VEPPKISDPETPERYLGAPTVEESLDGFGRTSSCWAHAGEALWNSQRKVHWQAPRHCSNAIGLLNFDAGDSLGAKSRRQIGVSPSTIRRACHGTIEGR
jgi:hypothetical protein